MLLSWYGLCLSATKQWEEGIVMKYLLSMCVGLICLLVNRGEASEVTITSQPVTTARVGQLYEYDVDAISNEPGDEITYELRESPEGMTIDRETGLIQWTPEQAGSFEIEIRANGESSGSGSGHDDQEYDLAVMNGEPASLAGVVHDQNGHGVDDVRLRLFEISTGHFLFSTTSDDDGEYSFSTVDPGSYYLRVAPDDDDNFAPQWYDRVTRIQDATQVDILEGSSMMINVTLLPRDSANVEFTLSGNVSDTSGVPIAGADVSIFRARHFDDHDPSGFNFDGLDDDDRDEHLETLVTTDSLGNYSVRLKTRTYILSASKEGFAAQFWDHKSNPLEADRLILQSDTSHIDFDLGSATVSNSSIGGLITTASTGAPIEAHVVGFQRLTPDGEFTGFKMHAETDSLGTYRLRNLRDGFYVVLAIPHEQFLPTFYDGFGGTLHVEQALPVAVHGGAVDNINIQVLPDTVAGMNRICGLALTDEGPLPGAIISVVSTQSNDAVAAAVTDQLGLYSIVGLRPGSYTATGTKPGFQTSSGTSFDVEYVGDLPASVMVDVSLPHLPTSVSEGNLTPEGFVLRGNYPNPFNPSTRIQFSIPAAGHVRLSIYNVLGEQVATVLNTVLNAGSHSIIWDARMGSTRTVVSTGVYYYRLEYGGEIRSGKMLLLR